MAEEKNIQVIKFDPDDNLKIMANCNMDILKNDCKEISGQFVIDAEDLCRIIPILNKETATKISYSYPYTEYILSKDDAVEELNNKIISLTKELEEISDKNEDLYNEISRERGLSDGLRRVILESIPEWLLKCFLKKEDFEFIKQHQ